MSKKPQYSYVHGCYVESRKNREEDAVIVKRYRIDADGTRTPEIKVHQNVKRDFWVTKPGLRAKQNSKLEYEYTQNLIKRTTTQRRLNRAIQNELGMIYNPKRHMRELCNSLYLYGVDKDITCLVSDQYKKAFPDVKPFDASVGSMDTETNVLDGSNDIIIMTFSYGKKAVASVSAKWLTDDRHTNEFIKDFLYKNVPEFTEKGIELEISIQPNPAECVIWIINKAHEWKPDLVSFWNIDFDFPKMIKALEDYGHDPADVFSDPSVPREFRYFKYKQGQTSKLTESGKYKPLSFSEQWHSVFTPSSFYFVDAGSTYRCLRRQKAEPSYSLEFITNKELGEGKFYVELEGLEYIPTGSFRWHKIMQRDHQLWYIAYALIDALRPVEMDEKIGDLAKKLPTLAMGSHYKDFNSNPRRLCDQLHGFFLSKGAVVGTTGSEMATPLDKLIPVSKDWIVTLAAANMEDTGVQLFAPDWATKSKVYIHNLDLDIVSTYPILGMLFNIARETTLYEFCKIEGLDYFTYREFGINLTGGKANSLLIATEVLNLKNFDDMLDQFEKDHKLPSTQERLRKEWDEKQQAKKDKSRAKAISSSLFT